MVGQLQVDIVIFRRGHLLSTSNGSNDLDPCWECSAPVWWYTPDLYIMKSSYTSKETDRGPLSTSAAIMASSEQPP